MKMQLKSTLLLIGAASAFFIGCQKNDGFTTPSSQTTVQGSNESVPSFDESSLSSAQSFSNAYSQSPSSGTSVYLTTTTVTAIGVPPVVLKTGTFIASHELGDTGLYVMHIKFFDPLLDSIHCITTFYPNKGGSFVTSSRCSIVTNIGKWVIVYGTGRYENLRGRGTVNMVPGHEMATGVVRWI